MESNNIILLIFATWPKNPTHSTSQSLVKKSKLSAECMYSIHFVLWPTILYHWLTLCQKLTFVRPLKNFLLVFQIHSPPTLTICLLRLPCLLFCLSNLKSPFEIGIVSSGSSSSSLTSPVSVSTSGESFLFCSKDKIQVLMTKNYFFIVAIFIIIIIIIIITIIIIIWNMRLLGQN